MGFGRTVIFNLFNTLKKLKFIQMKKETHILKSHYPTKRNTTVKASFQRHKNTITLYFELIGTVNEYHFKNPSKQQRADNLWKNTCFELFIANTHNNAYWEINISPSTQWNIYHFSDYKEGMKKEKNITQPIIKTTQKNNYYSLSFTSTFTQDVLNQELQINLAVILLDLDGVRHFYSIFKNSGNVDFHNKGFWSTN
jgi:hypothetical protein